MLESGPACDRVVVGEGDDIEALLVGTAQKIDRSDTWFLVVDRSGGVNVEIGAVPLSRRFIGRFGRARGLLRTSRYRPRTRASSCLANGNLLPEWERAKNRNGA
jgi:hypothetical protein